MQEIWKDVIGYEGLYQVSDCGNVRSICGRYGDEVILKQGIGSTGYRIVTLCGKGKQKTANVHRLVAKAFLPNPNGYPCINHKDENKTNNSVSNLEWCSYQYNNAYGKRILKMNQKRWKYVQCVETGVIYSSASYAQKLTGIIQTSISSCCRGKLKTAGGFHWKYFEK